MKKAKIMLMGIAVFGIVGGAFAFKASKLFDNVALVCTTTTAQGPVVCTVNGDISSVGVIPAGNTVFVTSYTTDPNGSNVCADANYTVAHSEVYCQSQQLQAFEG